MTIENQLERWKLFYEQVERASRCGIIVGIGDMNLDLEKLENSNIYLKKLAEEHLSMMGKNGLELLDFGTTWIRTQKKNGKIKCSSIDQAFTNKLTAIHSYQKNTVTYLIIV